MASDVLKCANCNIVINELLAFVKNKIDVIDEVALSQICTSAFSSEEILCAKKLLFDSIPTSHRMKIRKRDGKSARDMEDIVTLFKETKPEYVPIFVARDLQKLPPITFDHVDVTRLLKDQLRMQHDIKMIKEQYVSVEEFAELKSDLDNLKQASVVNVFERNINTRRGAQFQEEYDSGPMGLQIYSSTEENKSPNNMSRHSISVLSRKSSTDSSSSRKPEGNTSDKLSGECAITTANVSARSKAAMLPTEIQTGGCAPTDANVTVQSIHAMCNLTTNSSDVNNVNTNQLLTTRRRTTAEVVSEPGHWKSVEPSDEWKTVQRKRLKNRLVGAKGKADSEPEGKFKAADRTIPLFVSNIDKGSSESDIKKHIFDKTQLAVAIKKINMKSGKSYDAYKIFVPNSKLDVFLDENFWPNGILFRRFIEYKRIKDSAT